jgi:hypothetical protein
VIGSGRRLSQNARCHRSLEVALQRRLSGSSAGQRPLSCPHQIVPVVEARVVEMRRAHPGVGAAHDPVLARAREDRSAAGAHVDRALPGPPWAGHAPGPEAQAQRLQALGAVPVDGAVADGRCPISRPTRPIPDVHHLFSDCPSGQQIPPENREEGTDGWPLCGHCRRPPCGRLAPGCPSQRHDADGTDQI